MEQLVNLPIWTQFLIGSVVVLVIGLGIMLTKRTPAASNIPTTQSDAILTGRYYLALKKGQVDSDQFIPISDEATIKRMLTEAIAGNRDRWDQLATSKNVAMVPAGTAVVLKRVKEKLAEVEIDTALLKEKKIAGKDRWTVAAFVHKQS